MTNNKDPNQKQPGEKSPERAMLVPWRHAGCVKPDNGETPASSKRLGTRLVNALSQQLKGDLTRPTASSGVIFTLVVPL